MNPNDRNGTGLVLTVDSPSGNDGPVLLPGDAGYKLIDSVANPLPDKGPHDYQGIVVPHHGGKTPGATLTPAPTGSSANRLVYSLGAPNHYLQPSPECESSHQGKGWTEGMTRRTDAVGVPRPADVAIAWPGSTTITRGGDFDPAQ